MCSRAREVQVLSAERSPSLQLHNVPTWREKARKRLRPLPPHCAAAPPVHHGKQLSARFTRWIEKKARKGGGGRGDQKSIVEKRWREFFLDPSQWWDHRSEKVK
jgi:hypothetical protein